jgi:SAM-dependent methyltransferase
MTVPPPEEVETVRRTVAEADTRRANRRDWDQRADEYQAEHGAFLGDARFIWSPEGVDEAEARILGSVRGADVLELGCGAGQCSRWLRSQGARATGVDLSFRQLQHARRIDQATDVAVPAVCATATDLPFGALAEVARVLRPGGRFAFSVTHPVRWCLPDDPTERGLTVTSPYWDRTPYVEQDAQARITYVEHHRTLGDWVRLLVASGFRLEDLREPEWPPGLDRVWGGWGPVRGQLIPGTAIFSARRG